MEKNKVLEDEDMVLNHETNRYVLTLDYVMNKMGIDLNATLYDEFDVNTGTMAERTIEYASDIVYDWLEANSGSMRKVNKFIQTKKEWFNKFKKALAYQLFALHQEGDQGLLAGDDINKLISVRTKQVLYRLTNLQDLRPRLFRVSGIPLDSSFYNGDLDGGIW